MKRQGSFQALTRGLMRLSSLQRRGTREETERWLDRNRGLVISCNPGTHKVTVTHVTDAQPREIPGINYSKLTEANIPYFERLTDFDPSEFIPTRSLVRELKRVDDNTSEA